MTEIVMDIISIDILNIEVLIPLGHWMILRDMGNHMDIFFYLTGLVYQDKSVFVYLRPLCCNAMQISPFGIKLTAYRIGRDDNSRLLITFKQITQTACMVTMPMRNENIVHIAEIYAQQLCVSDKHITCSCIKQDLVPLCLQED